MRFSPKGFYFMNRTISFVFCTLAGWLTTTGAPDADAQNVYVSNNRANNILVFNSTGNLINTFGGGIVNGPAGLAFDSSGNLYVANGNGTTISEFTSGGAFIATIAPDPRAIQLQNPEGLVFRPASGQLFVSDARHTVRDYSTTTHSFNSNPVYNSFDFRDELTGLATNSTGSVDVANAGNGKIVEFFGPGSTIDTNADTGLVSGTTGLAYDSAGNLYAANRTGGLISVYNTSRTFVKNFGNANLSTPYGLAFDGSGNLFVANSGSDSISEFNSAGVFQRSITGNGLNAPRYVAILPAAADAATPEPGTFALLAALALSGIGFARRRQRK